MRLPITKTLRVYPNPWGVSPGSVTDEVLADRAKRKLNAVDHSTMDHEGRPNGAFMSDPLVDGGAQGRRVGALVCEEHTTKHARGRSFMSASFDTTPQRTVYSFNGCTAHEFEPFELAGKLAKTDPVPLPMSEYYKAALRTGELIAADEQTAKEAGVSFEFESPETLFLKLAKAATVAFDAHYNGDKAYEHFVRERKKSRDLANADAPAAAPEATREASKSKPSQKS